MSEVYLWSSIRPSPAQKSQHKIKQRIFLHSWVLLAKAFVYKFPLPDNGDFVQDNGNLFTNALPLLVKPNCVVTFVARLCVEIFFENEICFPGFHGARPVHQVITTIK